MNKKYEFKVGGRTLTFENDIVTIDGQTQNRKDWSPAFIGDDFIGLYEESTGKLFSIYNDLKPLNTTKKDEINI